MTMKKKIENSEIKIELCKMLKALDEYLSKNNIKYSIMSGTMLGAIRHGGFIPWDDDIDIAILREDYDKLIELLKKDKYINKDLRASGFEVDETDWLFTKIYNDSILIQDDLMKEQGNLWIDVFPFDNLKNNLQWRKILFLRKLYIKKRATENFYGEINKKNDFFHSLRTKIAIEIAKHVDKNKLINFYMKICTKYKKNSCTYVADLTWGKKEIPKYLFDEIVDYKFENITVKGFKDFDTYLKCIYGNYMQLPPENQRINHGIKAWRILKDEK